MKMCTEEKQKWTYAVWLIRSTTLPSILPSASVSHRFLLPPPPYCLDTAPVGLKNTLREKVDGGDEMAVVSGAVPDTGGELSYN
jgi:hypothetical protein